MHPVPVRSCHEEARPNFCLECSSNGKQSRLRFNLISLSTGIWLCSDRSCNFPLDAEKIERWIEKADAVDEKELILQKKSRRSKGQLDIHSRGKKRKYTQKPKRHGICLSDTSLAQEMKEGTENFRKTDTMNRFLKGNIEMLANVCKNPNMKQASESCSPWEASDQKKVNESKDLHRNLSLEFQKNYEIPELDNNSRNLISLKKYTPFMTKQSKDCSMDVENESGFVVLESNVTDIEENLMQMLPSKDELKECYDNDSAYSSPLTEGSSLSCDLVSGDDHDFYSALEMFDSLLDTDSKLKDEICSLDRHFLLDNDNFDQEIDVSKLM